MPKSLLKSTHVLVRVLPKTMPYNLLTEDLSKPSRDTKHFLEIKKRLPQNINIDRLKFSPLGATRLSRDTPVTPPPPGTPVRKRFGHYMQEPKRLYKILCESFSFRHKP